MTTTDDTTHRAVLMQRIGVLEVELQRERERVVELEQERVAMKTEIERWRAGSVR